MHVAGIVFHLIGKIIRSVFHLGLFIMERPLLAAIVAGLLVLLFLRWALFPQRSLPGNRVRHQLISTHLRLHPGRGHATIFELWQHWGKWSVLRKSKRTRPDLSYWQRLRHPREHSVFIGRGHWRHALRILAELHVLVMSPPRMGKTLWLCKMILRYPGPVINTSVKEDVFRLTSGIRAKRGRIHVFNPQGIGGVPSTFQLNPVAGCEVKSVAIRRAQALCNAADTASMKDGDWFKSKAAQILAELLYVAALLRGDLQVVASWVFKGTERAEEQLLRLGEETGAAVVYELHNSPAEKTRATFQMVLSQVLGFLGDPALAVSVLPREGLGFDIASFIESRDTLYLITDSDQDTSPLAPLFAMFLSEFKAIGTMIGQRNTTGRLRRPNGWFLDEITQCAPIALDKILAACGGLGIQVFTVVHGEAQLRKRWGDNGAQIIWDASNVKLLLPGITDDKTLEKMSRICGKVSYQQKDQEHKYQYDVMEPAMIRALPDRMGVAVRNNRAPMIVHLPRVIRDLGYLRAKWRGQDVAKVLGVIEQQAVRDQVTAQVLEQLEDAPAVPVVHGGNGHNPSAYPWAERLWPSPRKAGTPQTSLS